MFRSVMLRAQWLRQHRPWWEERRRPGARPRLLVDVSAIIRHDAQTGIQRVVRSVWSELRKRDTSGFDCVPVFATGRHGYCEAPANFLDRAGPLGTCAPVKVSPGDKFLGLDLSAHLLPKYASQVRAWRRAGASIHLVVYDLLPISRPDWFNPTTSRHFRRWFRFLTQEADQAICISATVATELRGRLEGTTAANRLSIGRLPMGADIALSMPSAGMSGDVQSVVGRMRFRPAVLMVGTIEPRKGYEVALSAFDFLWRTSPTTAPDLVIVGKRGWKTSKLQARIRAHPLFGKRLYWLEGVSDEGLCACYEAARGLLVTSRAEGFGLPLVEAAEHNLPALARDLPVFHEQNLPNVIFFSDDQPQALARQILRLTAMNKTTEPAVLVSWSRAVEVLLDELALVQIQQRFVEAKARDVR